MSRKPIASLADDELRQAIREQTALVDQLIASFSPGLFMADQRLARLESERDTRDARRAP